MSSRLRCSSANVSGGRSHAAQAVDRRPSTGKSQYASLGTGRAPSFVTKRSAGRKPAALPDVRSPGSIRFSEFSERGRRTEDLDTETRSGAGYRADLVGEPEVSPPQSAKRERTTRPDPASLRRAVSDERPGPPDLSSPAVSRSLHDLGGEEPGSFLDRPLASVSVTER
jgi:hypothetical protein